MVYAAWYNKSLAGQFFRRSVEELRNPNSEGFDNILSEEVDYLANRFAETAVVSENNEFPFPHPTRKQPWLAKDLLVKKNPKMSRMAEMTANCLLFFEGFHAYDRLYSTLGDENVTLKLDLIRDLYRFSSEAPFRGEEEAFLLRQLARNSVTWFKLLGFIPRYDYIQNFAFVDRLAGSCPIDPRAQGLIKKAEKILSSLEVQALKYSEEVKDMLRPGKDKIILPNIT
jgi:hypothetical protein